MVWRLTMANFVKGILVGLGAVAPGLSGSVLLVMFGLYRKTIAAISSLFQNLRENMRYLLPLAAGIGVGVLLFSRLVDWLLAVCQMQTRFAFLGLILGSIPMLFREVRQEGFRRRHWLIIALAMGGGLTLFQFNRSLFPVVSQPSLLQSVLLGVAVGISYIVPGVDSAAILSALGLYSLWVHSLATLNFAVLLPALVGAAAGVLLISSLMNQLLRRFYTATYCIIFGLFLSVAPAVIDESCVIGPNLGTVIAFLVFLAGFFASLLFGSWERLRANNKHPQE